MIHIIENMKNIAIETVIRKLLKKTKVNFYIVIYLHYKYYSNLV